MVGIAYVEAVRESCSTLPGTVRLCCQIALLRSEAAWRSHTGEEWMRSEMAHDPAEASGKI